MEASEEVKSLLSEEALVRRASARTLSGLAESDPGKFKEDDLAVIIKVLREEDDTLTLGFLLKIIDYVSSRSLPFLVSTGVLRALVEVYLRNMGGLGAAVGRDAMRLISNIASTDAEGAEKLDVVGLILRTLADSSDPYVRWYASIGLRKLDPSLIQKGSIQIVGYSMDALAKDDEKIRVSGALALTVVASISPEALQENDALRTIIKTLPKERNPEVQELLAMTLEFAATRDASRLAGTKIGEALCETILSKLEALKKGENRVNREVLVSAASTLSIITIKDPRILSEKAGAEEVDISGVIADALSESREEDEVRPILLSVLLNLSDKAEYSINNKKVIKVLTDLLEIREGADVSRRLIVTILDKAASKYPILFSDSSVLEKMVEFSLKDTKAATGATAEQGPAGADVLDTLASSEEGYKVIVATLRRIYKDKPYLVSEICETRDWNNIMKQVKGEQVSETRVERPERVAIKTIRQKVREESVAEIKRQPVAPAAEEERKREKPPRSTRLTDEQRALLQEVLHTYDEISLKELAEKLDVEEGITREVLGKLVQSGKLPYRIEGDMLYLKGKPKAKPVRRRKPTLCIWCGAEMATSDEKCPSCGKAPPKCLICDVELTTEDKIEKCPFCGTLFHREHYQKWAQSGKNCPKCSVSWS